MVNKASNTAKNGTVSVAVREILNGFDSRTRDVVEKRFGLTSGKILTLAEIGNQYSITRERVRQIEASALKEAHKHIAKGVLSKFVDTAAKTVKSYGGARRADSLVGDLSVAHKNSAKDKHFSFITAFVLEASGKLTYKQEDDEWKAYWYTNKNDRKALEAFVAKAYKSLKVSKESVLASSNDTAALLNKVGGGMKATIAENHLAISKKFTANKFNDFGLSEWSEVNPKTARDWAYLILKKENKPLHFRELADRISKHRVNKHTNFQTVHNELIKDNRFVLVGRGVYGLREFGILPGTAREVITHFLKKNGALSFGELAKAINSERAFKENTILINLQNKSFFKKRTDGKYTLREA